MGILSRKIFREPFRVPHITATPVRGILFIEKINKYFGLRRSLLLADLLTDFPRPKNIDYGDTRTSTSR